MLKHRIFLFLLVFILSVITSCSNGNNAQSPAADGPGTREKVSAAPLVTTTTGTGPLDTWKPRTVSFQTTDIAYGNGFYAAFGWTSAVVTSADKREWVQTTFSGPSGFRSVTYFNGKFVAINWSWESFSSTDGVNWSPATAMAFDVRSLTTGSDVTINSGGVPAVVAAGYGVAKSTDGVNWTTIANNSTIDHQLNGIAYSPNSNTYVTAGGYYTGYGAKIYTYSVVGVVQRLSVFEPYFYGVAYGNNAFVVVGSRGYIYRSVNTSPNQNNNNEGTDWTQQTSNTTKDLRSIAFGNGIFVVIGADNTLFTSTDGATWTERSFGAMVNPVVVRFINNEFVAISTNGGIATSPDGIIWTCWTPDISNQQQLSAVAYGNNGFVAVGNNGTIVNSSDGVNWTSRMTGTTRLLNSVAYGNGTYVAVGDSGAILTSPTGSTWTAQNSGTTSDLDHVVYGNGTFVAAGYDLTTTSTDGISWTTHSSAPILYDIAFGNTVFIGSGEQSTAWTSSDGAAWNSRPTNSSYGLNALAFGNGVTLATSYLGTLYTSSGTEFWTSRTSGTSNSLYGAAFGNNTYLVFGNDTLLSSNDARTWTLRISGGTGSINSAAYGSNTFVIVGGNYGSHGFILQTPTLSPESAPDAGTRDLAQPSISEFRHCQAGERVIRPNSNG